MGCEGQAFNRGQGCDEKEWTGRLMCAYPIEAREHRLLPRFLWGEDLCGHGRRCAELQGSGSVSADPHCAQVRITPSCPLALIFLPLVLLSWEPHGAGASGSVNQTGR